MANWLKWTIGGLVGLTVLGLLLNPAEPPAVKEAGSESEAGRDYLLLIVDPGRPVEEWHKAAKLRCASRDRCEVYGWTSSADAATGLPFTNREAETIAFYYGIDRSRGFERVAWDCDRFPRANVIECFSKLDLPG